MITRIWRGWTTPENAPAYQKIVSEDVLPSIAARNFDGYHPTASATSMWSATSYWNNTSSTT